MSTKRGPVIAIRKARNPLAPGWIVHDMRPQNQVRTVAWRNSKRNLWRKYPTWSAAMSAAERALRQRIPLPPPMWPDDFTLARCPPTPTRRYRS